MKKYTEYKETKFFYFKEVENQNTMIFPLTQTLWRYIPCGNVIAVIFVQTIIIVITLPLFALDVIIIVLTTLFKYIIKPLFIKIGEYVNIMIIHVLNAIGYGLKWLFIVSFFVIALFGVGFYIYSLFYSGAWKDVRDWLVSLIS
jgi:hypothetical protein